MKPIIACFLFFSFLLSAQALGDVLRVGGPQADYSSLASAVNAANSGDVLMVAPGTYASFTINNKSLSVVPTHGVGGSIHVAGVIRILNLSQGQSVELRGLHEPGTLEPLKLIASQCQGSIRIEDCSFYLNEAESNWAHDYCVELSQCDDVAFSNCSLVGRDWSGYPTFCSAGSGKTGPSGILATDSNLAMYQSSVIGGGGGFVVGGGIGCFGYGGDGGDAIHLVGSGHFFSSGCYLESGSEGTGPSNAGTANDGRHGWTIIADSGYNVTHLDTSFLPDVSWTILIYGTETQLTGPSTWLDTPYWISESDLLDVTVHGEVGARAGLFFATGYDHNTLVPGGPLLVDIPASGSALPWLYLGSFGPTGTISTTIPIRDLPTFAHVKLHLTARTISALGARNTNSSSPLVLDSAW